MLVEDGGCVVVAPNVKGEAVDVVVVVVVVTTGVVDMGCWEAVVCPKKASG